MDKYTSGVLLFACLSCNTVLADSADNNGDGKADILWRHAVSGENWLYQMDGATIVNSHRINTVSDFNWQIVGRADLDGDGKADVLWRNSSTGQLYRYLMDGYQFTDMAAVAAADLQLHDAIYALDDLNGDGRADLIAGRYGVIFALIQQDDGHFAYGFEFPTGYAYYVTDPVFTPDLNGDGQTDVVASLGDLFFYFYGDFDQAIEQGGQVIKGGLSMHMLIGNILLTGDFDGNGSDEFLMKNGFVDGEYFTQSFDVKSDSLGTQHIIGYVYNTDWKPLMAADFDNDGIDDILWRNRTTGENYLYLMNATGFVGKPVNKVTDLNWKLFNTANVW